VVEEYLETEMRICESYDNHSVITLLHNGSVFKLELPFGNDSSLYNFPGCSGRKLSRCTLGNKVYSLINTGSGRALDIYRNKKITVLL
jgi:hypothetical protein